MSRFFVPKQYVRGKVITVRGPEAHHILDVMRLQRGDVITAFDGTGREYDGVVSNTSRRGLEIEITASRQRNSSIRQPVVRLIQGIPKKDKMDHIIEKTTELGVAEIIPVVTERTIPSWDIDKMETVAERWRRIAIAASKQCGRTDIPAIGAVTAFSSAIGRHDNSSLSLIAALDDKAISLKEALRGHVHSCISIAIGPEGDFTQQEIASAVDKGFRLVSLGPRVLKSDTASLAVLAVIQYEMS